MRRPVVVSLFLAAGLVLVPLGAALADEPGAGITVEPDAVTAGQTILLAGNGLEPDVHVGPMFEKKAMEKGMLSLLDDGALKIANGETTIAEVLSVTQEDI